MNNTTRKTGPRVLGVLLALGLAGWGCTESGSELADGDKVPAAAPAGRTAPAGQEGAAAEGSGTRSRRVDRHSGSSTPGKGDKIMLSDEEWKEKLTPEQYYICRQKGTERAFTGKYWNHKKDGMYVCVACGNELFSSETKFDSGTGWPSYWAPVDGDNVKTETDRSFFMTRTEVLCNRCDSHLGHVFDDGPDPTNLRYCINSASLDFREKGKAERAGAPE